MYHSVGVVETTETLLQSGGSSLTNDLWQITESILIGQEPSLILARHQGVHGSNIN